MEKKTVKPQNVAENVKLLLDTISQLRRREKEKQKLMDERENQQKRKQEEFNAQKQKLLSK